MLGAGVLIREGVFDGLRMGFGIDMDPHYVLPCCNPPPPPPPVVVLFLSQISNQCVFYIFAQLKYKLYLLIIFLIQHLLEPWEKTGPPKTSFSVTF